MLSAQGGQEKPRPSMEHRSQACFFSAREYGKCLFLGWALVKNQKTFLQCSIKKFPFREILETVSGGVFYQGLF